MSALVGEKAALRPIAAADTDSIVRWRNDPEVLRYFVDRRVLTREAHESWLRTRVAAGLVEQFIITDRSSARDVGTAFVRDIDSANGTAEFGFFIGEADARGKGLGCESCRLLCEYAFSRLGLRRLIARVLGFNARSAAVFERVGFAREGVLREHVAHSGGYCDLIFFGLLKEELK